MTRNTKYLTVRVNEDESAEIWTDHACLHMHEFAVHDLIDSLAAMGYADYMITSAQTAKDEAQEHAYNPFVTCLKSLAENE